MKARLFFGGTLDTIESLLPIFWGRWNEYLACLDNCFALFLSLSCEEFVYVIVIAVLLCLVSLNSTTVYFSSVTFV